MTARQLRAILARYGNAGVLFVGSYLLSHHVWRHRRWQVLLAVGFLSVLSFCMLHRIAPVRKVPRKQGAVVVSAPSPVASPLRLPLQDDTTPVPFPDAEGDAPIRSEGAIFFSANFYHWSNQFYTYERSGEKEETLASDEDTHHLFRLTVGMARPRQLTYGEAEDRQPTLAPNGRQLAFLRQKGDRSSLCLVSTKGGRVETLLHLPDGSTCDHVSWSPDGRWFALQLSRDGEKKELLLLQVGNRTAIRLSEIREAVWSPDGRLYLRSTDDQARIFQPSTRSSVSIKSVVLHAVWLDAHTLIGDSPEQDAYQGRNDCLRLIDDWGQQIRELPLALLGNENRYTTFHDSHMWHRLPSHPSTVLLETWRWMSDAEHYGCFRVDLRTGQARLVADGKLVGIAPDGSCIAVAENAWVGPYKCGGKRVGPLKIVSIATGRADSVTDPLSCIWEGVWQPDAVRASRSHVASLLETVSSGDLTKIGALLAGGADPDTADPNGTTALMIATADGQAEMVRLLLQHGARVDPIDRHGNTALLYAIDAEKMSNEVATSAQIAIADILLQAGAKINVGNHAGYTALMLAAGEGRAVAANWLLKHGATPNACSKSGQTALMLAAFGNYSHTVQVLLDARAAVNVKNKDDETALDIVQLYRHDNNPRNETITLLQQAGAVAQP